MASVTKELIKQLNKTLEEARDAYYKHTTPIMSDAAYDEGEKLLRKYVAEAPHLAEYAPVLKTVGSDLTAQGRVKHVSPMLSIENQYTFDDVLAWYVNLKGEVLVVCVEPKWDGISVSLIYEKGILVRALTRGTGTEGEDITEQAQHVSLLPKALQSGRTLEVRGELVMRHSTLARINEEAEAKGEKIYSSTRNLTGGTMKLKGDKIRLIAEREILIKPWDVLGAGLADSGLDRLRSLVQDGFPEPDGRLALNAEELVDLLNKRLEENKSSDIQADGVVIKVNSQELRRKLGVASKYTNWQVCYKPQAASGTTYLREIQWQVGRTGRVSPVAKCDVVILAGANITSASLNNITYIRNMGLKLNAKVEMLRSGDVIPQIVRVIDEGDEEIMPPTNCPECKMTLTEKDEGGEGILQQFCTNTHCPAILQGYLAFIGSRDVLEIDGLGPEMARKLVEGDYARNLWELYEFQADLMKVRSLMGDAKLLESTKRKGFDVTILKMLDSLEKAKTAPWERWIKALGIPMVGETLGKALAERANLKPEDMEHLPQILLFFLANGVEGFGPEKTKSVQDWCDENAIALCKKLFEFGVRPTAVEKPKVAEGAPLKGVVFCITGEFSEDRDTITKKLVSLGAEAKSGVTKKLTHLIVGSAPGKTKLTKAESLGIKQYDNAWLAKVLSDNGLGLKADTFAAEQA